MKVMILAAGRGQRLRPLTDRLPKPLLPVQGKPLIVHHLERLSAAGFTEIVINIAWLGDMIKSRLGHGEHFGVSIRYSEEMNNTLDTGGGIFNALPLLGSEAFLVLNADVYTDFPFSTLKTALGQDDLIHLVMVANPAHHPAGDFRLSGNGRLYADGDTRLTYSGIGVHHPKFFAACKPGRFPLLPWWQKSMRDGKASGQLYSGLWKDVGSVQALQEIEGLPRA